MTRRSETLVIGASAAGLATAACLQRAGQRTVLLEAADDVAASWRGRYDRLHLHTPRAASALPGLEMPAGWRRYLARDQVVSYLEQYRDHHRLAPQYGQRVLRLEREGGDWVATTADRQWRAGTAVVATGFNRRPVLPSWPGIEDFRGEILHSSAYRNPTPWHGERVLVVGFGNSACEQAVDLVEGGVETHLSVRSPVNVIPRDLLGVPVLRLGAALHHLPARAADALAWPLVRLTVGDIRRLGLDKLPYGPMTQIARTRRIPLLDSGALDQLRAGRITLHGAISRFTPEGVEFIDGTKLEVTAVVLGTGYVPALAEFLPEWAAVCDPSGVPYESGRPTALPGLFFCGYRVSPAGMLHDIAHEARLLAAQLRGRP
ncbi:NAD(P)/FAD-dependent oxidoreductase [Microlunatus elymi]|uniref:NAD(P)/FAD-dependent oxidoreductase n=1 Tax=Microlunatus elymi TaxID=2596828 RepID=A0A516PXW7_9ACTN|nr:NAD(P)/FAD-dependent oxidoreductase [Microlunatus elymi]QDP96017.1 NAD(P)/FAD-dependent oxidoreductase [Microlunatus elymi]